MPSLPRNCSGILIDVLLQTASPYEILSGILLLQITNAFATIDSTLPLILHIFTFVIIIFFEFEIQYTTNKKGVRDDIEFIRI